MSEWKIIKSMEPSQPEPEWDFARQHCQVFVEVTLDEDLLWEFGDVPDWLDYELCEVGWKCVFGVVDPEKFALENGLCPGQTFTLVVWPPEWFSDYWGERDVEYQWEWWGAASVAPKEHLARWLEWLEMDQDEAYLERLHRWLLPRRDE